MKFKNSMIAVSLALFVSATSAGEFDSVILEVGSISTQFAFITTETHSPSTPVCASILNKFSFDKTTTEGQALLVDSLNAYLNSEPVLIKYDDVICSGDGAWLGLIQVVNN